MARKLLPTEIAALEGNIELELLNAPKLDPMVQVPDKKTAAYFYSMEIEVVCRKQPLRWTSLGRFSGRFRRMDT
ncbi:hypothetical protein Golomagni_06301 [Golovinomyces magnicellulatus]|nr:hypothetical protein Golomagni_06301 [Golovinomyces magnicellulatus]